MNLEDTTLGEICQPQKDKYHVILLLSYLTSQIHSKVKLWLLGVGDGKMGNYCLISFSLGMVKILNFILLYFTTIKTFKKTTLSFQVYIKMQIPRLWTQSESDPGLKLYTPENHCPFLSSLKSHFEP